MQRDLVLRAKTGDHAAFTALAAEAIDRLHRTAHLILRDSDRASDAVQDALLSAWLDIRAVRDPDRFDAWLNRLLVRACYRVAGRERRRELTEIKVEGLDAPARVRGVRVSVLIAAAIASIVASASLGASPTPEGVHGPWIVYHWGHLGLVRPDGTGDHPIAPEFAWDQIDDGAYWGSSAEPRLVPGRAQDRVQRRARRGPTVVAADLVVGYRPGGRERAGALHRPLPAGHAACLVA